MRSLFDLLAGLARHPLRFLGYAFTAFSSVFTLLKGIDFFIPGVTITGPTVLLIVILGSLAFATKKVWKPSKVKFSIPHTNTTIEILFADIFSLPGLRAIGVTRYFETALGKAVSDQSLHGMLIVRGFGGRPESLDAQLAGELANVEFQTRTKQVGKQDQYPIGTTALVKVNDDRYILFALADADILTCKASSDVTMLWTALNELWKRVRIEAGGHPVNVPLVGTGLTGIGLPTRDVLNLVVLSAITETKAKEVTPIIRVVLHRSRFEDLDLREVVKHWKE